jgi:hypothetical protein
MQYRFSTLIPAPADAWTVRVGPHQTAIGIICEASWKFQRMRHEGFSAV